MTEKSRWRDITNAASTSFPASFRPFVSVSFVCCTYMFAWRATEFDILEKELSQVRPITDANSSTASVWLTSLSWPVVHDLHDLWQASTVEGVSVVGQPVGRSLPFYRGLACIFVSCRCRVAERSCQQRNPDSASGIGTRRYHRWRDNAFIFDLWQFDKLCSNIIESLACKVANNKYPRSFIFRKLKKKNSIYFNLNY